MELEFDKEMDAILRKARGDTAASSGSVVSAHIDADSVAAFAENALPDKAKLLYMEHFADCDGCRKLLSQTVLMNAEAVSATGGAASSSVAAAAIPWYQSIFRTPNLAFTMGALVLAFSGFLGYLALQNRTDSNNVALSRAPEQKPAEPYSSGEAPSAASNSPANTAANSANSSAPVMPYAESNSTVGTSGPSAGKAGEYDSSGVGKGDPSTTADADKKLSLDRAEEQPAKPVAAAPAPPRDQLATMRDEAKTETARERNKDDVALAKKKESEDARNNRRDGGNAASKSGPSRASGQVQMQNQSITGYDMSSTRSAGGKTFEKRNGAWYDSAYHGQATTSVRRGTDAYKKLDKGLRSIGDNLGGTVVVVWKEKAYRIN